MACHTGREKLAVYRVIPMTVQWQIRLTRLPKGPKGADL